MTEQLYKWVKATPENLPKDKDSNLKIYDEDGNSMGKYKYDPLQNRWFELDDNGKYYDALMPKDWQFLAPAEPLVFPTDKAMELLNELINAVGDIERDEVARKAYSWIKSLQGQ